MTPDERFMSLAIDEARKGLGRTHPNPAVGAVIVKRGRVIATGYHRRLGAPHAEIEAMANAAEPLPGSTLYSTLEPCSHFGRTPPCADAIIRAGIARVVFACDDPNPLVNGKGAAKLLNAGVKVTAHVLAEVAASLNRPFLKVMRTGLPWVTLKVAATLDGKIATAKGDSKWVTSETARLRAHEWRNQVDAVIVGSGTVLADDPQLTTRLALEGKRNPARVVLDGRLRCSPKSRVFDRKDGARVIVITNQPENGRAAKALTARGVEVWRVKSLHASLKRLAAEGLLHLMVEGGAGVHQRFIEEGLFDEVLMFVAPKLVGGRGLTWSGDWGAPTVNKAVGLELTNVERIGTDALLTLVKRLP